MHTVEELKNILTAEKYHILQDHILRSLQKEVPGRIAKEVGGEFGNVKPEDLESYIKDIIYHTDLKPLWNERLPLSKRHTVLLVRFQPTEGSRVDENTLRLEQFVPATALAHDWTEVDVDYHLLSETLRQLCGYSHPRNSLWWTAPLQPTDPRVELWGREEYLPDVPALKDVLRVFAALPRPDELKIRLTVLKRQLASSGEMDA